jgi:hypothetical protein
MSILTVRLPSVKPVYLVIGVRRGGVRVVLAERPTFYAAFQARRLLLDGGVEGYARLIIETAESVPA